MKTPHGARLTLTKQNHIVADPKVNTQMTNYQPKRQEYQT